MIEYPTHFPPNLLFSAVNSDWSGKKRFVGCRSGKEWDGIGED